MNYLVFFFLIFSVNCIGQVEVGYLEFSGKRIPIDSVTTDYAAFIGHMTTDSSFMVATPGKLGSIACENLYTGSIIYLDHPLDSMKVDFKMGKIKLDDNKTPEDFKLKIYLDGKFCWTDKMEIVFINENSKSFNVGMIQDVDFLLSFEDIEKPRSILIRNISFSDTKHRYVSLYYSFLFELE